ncbi:hypothetical protein C8R45DRAFT_1157296 [Mycena sanguinolenta]|nr:hypothetical protein C8R45DRAFT_1157296 [Mycena sanguinolenta]
MSFNANIVIGYIHSQSNFQNTASFQSFRALLVQIQQLWMLDVVRRRSYVGCGSKVHRGETLHQAAHYYRDFKHDGWMLKLLVSSAIAIDSVSMIANYASVYLVYLLLLPHEWASKRSFDPLYLFATGLVAALAQSFLAARYWLLYGFISFHRDQAPNLALEPETDLSPSFYSALSPRNWRRVRLWHHDRSVPRIYGSEEGRDPRNNLAHYRSRDRHFNASTLLWELRKAKSSFKETRRGACDRLNRLVARTIKTGTAGASMALAVLVAFLANKESNGGFLRLLLSILAHASILVPTGIAYGLGPVYCITMLANLNSRETGKSWSGRGKSSHGANVETRGERSNHERSEGGDAYGSIHVHRTAVVPELSGSQ